MLLVGRREEHPASKKLSVGVVICLERGADLHIVQLMPLLLTVSCFSKIQIGFTFLVVQKQNKLPFDSLLVEQHFCQKLSKSVDVCRSYCI